MNSYERLVGLKQALYECLETIHILEEIEGKALMSHALPSIPTIAYEVLDMRFNHARELYEIISQQKTKSI